MKTAMKTIVVSVGGSLVVPSSIDVSFLDGFKKLVLKQIKKGKRFIIICGGGKTAREYQQAARKVGKLTKDDLDWLGIHATRINAHLLRTIFRNAAHPKVIKNPNEKVRLRKNEKVLIASGWKPGCSTDYDAVLLAKNFKVKKLVNLTNIDYVYDKDPKRFKDAKPLKRLSWKKFIEILPRNWSPGLNIPFDPVAARKAKQLGLEVVIMNGKKLENFENYLEGKSFIGTVIK